MNLKINQYPHAYFNSKSGEGWLLYYYPWDAVTDGHISKEQWRRESYSPEILNFKEGKLKDIEFFVKPFLQLIQFARLSNNGPAYLIPIPSSTAKNDPNYSLKPFQKGTGNRKNRDDRNTVFCNLIAAEDSTLGVADVLTRIENKPEKAVWTEELHARSLEVNTHGFLNESTFATLVLVDDIKTKGGTLAGAKNRLSKIFPKANIISMTIGVSKDPGMFEPV